MHTHINQHWIWHNDARLTLIIRIYKIHTLFNDLVFDTKNWLTTTCNIMYLQNLQFFFPALNLE